MYKMESFFEVNNTTEWLEPLKINPANLLEQLGHGVIFLSA